MRAGMAGPGAGSAALRHPATARESAGCLPNADPRALRSALGRFATGVTVVATQCGGELVQSMTVNSFTSLSLDPALILWTLRTGSARYASFAHCELFSVNVLAASQVDIARRHAQPSPGIAAAHWDGFRSGCPVVDGASVQFICRSRNVVPEGDHAILIGEVLDYADFERKPLLFVAGGFFSGAALERL
jgi:flavin reductase (DIM6/NTAB) family NADH-FMN oxidoreductase RutF